MFFFPYNVYSWYHADQFSIHLIFHSFDWWVVRLRCHENLAARLLSGNMQPALWISEAEAKELVIGAIQYQRAVTNNAHWSPSEVSGLGIGQLVFRTSLDDAIFRRLYYAHIGNLPGSFFAQVRSSMQALLSAPEPDSEHEFPHARMVRSITSLSGEDRRQMRKMLTWDPRWGYTFWHTFVQDSGGIRVSLISFVDRLFRSLIILRYLGSKIQSRATSCTTRYGTPNRLGGCPCTRLIQTKGFFSGQRFPPPSAWWHSSCLQ